MSGKSAIEWTDATWNPVTGCTKVSPGCDNCYAERFAERWRGIKGHAFEQGFDIKLHPERLEWPITRKKPLKIFVNSMSDLFHRDVPDEFVSAVFDTMGRAEIHKFQVLTKRPERMRRIVPQIYRDLCSAGPYLTNVWLGVSVESAAYKWRIDMLREAPAAIRFLSIEPLVDDVGELNLDGIHWVIVGGESGPGARQMDPKWARGVRDQCVAAGVPFFFKQWGEWRPTRENDWGFTRGVGYERVGKKFAGRELDDREWNEFPEVVA